MNKLDKNTNNLETCYGERDGKIVHVSEVEKGLACGCICPGCGGELMAKKGEVNKHHFAHLNKATQYCNESILHKLAKQIIMEEMSVQVPECHIIMEDTDEDGKLHTVEFKDKPYTLVFENVTAEKSAGEFIPDLTCTGKDEFLYVEIIVSNDVSEEKHEKVTRYGLNMMKIDISDCDIMDSYEEIKKAVLFEAPREWLFNKYHEGKKAELKQQLLMLVSEANNRIKEKPVFKTEYDETIILGFVSGHGFSKKTQNDFDISILKIANKVTSASTTNFNLRASGGYAGKDVLFIEPLIDKLQGVSFPCVGKLKMARQLIQGRSQDVIYDIDFKA